jgi:putative Holliday junction resolvase
MFQHLESSWQSAPKGVRLLGLDHGTKTLGLALSDPDQRVVTPLKTIQRGKFEADLAALKKVIDDYGVGGLIVGWPLNMDGRPGPRAQSVKDYMAMVDARLPIWWAVWDERLSTDAAYQFMDHLSFDKREKAVDALAAQSILQGAIDFIAANRAASAQGRTS